ncbi:MAG TPA: Uma2 family endonuclease [Armatimonadota bacterium]|nr:Uma2 family endonuclease [Armatimonadota bacterium]
MSTSALRTEAPSESVPLLENGDCLSREEFERRYEAMPRLKKAELLRGVVYMPSPVSLGYHGEPHSTLVWWIVTYKMATSGLRSGDNSTVRLGPEDEPQPDILLMIPHERGGQALVGPESYVEGAPELAVEVAASSVSYDLHIKRSVYEERGIREYIVWRVKDHAIDWFALQGDRYQPLQPGPDGILRSEVFPGLWLDPKALIAGDGPRLMAVLQQGIASPEHAAFVERLQG